MPPQFAALSPYIKQSAGVVGSVYGYTSLDNIGERNITAKQGSFNASPVRQEKRSHSIWSLY